MQIASDTSSDPEDQNIMHIPVCYPKIAQSITFFPHACFSNKRAARQFLEREEDFICHATSKGLRVTGLALI